MASVCICRSHLVLRAPRRSTAETWIRRGCGDATDRRVRTLTDNSQILRPQPILLHTPIRTIYPSQTQSRGIRVPRYLRRPAQSHRVLRHLLRWQCRYGSRHWWMSLKRTRGGEVSHGAVALYTRFRNSSSLYTNRACDFLLV